METSRSSTQLLLHELKIHALFRHQFIMPALLDVFQIVQVPAFINEGEKIRVDTAEGAYMSRA